MDFADVLDYVSDNATGTAAGLWAMHRVGFRGRLVLASSMVVYGEGRSSTRRAPWCRRPPRRRADLDAGRWEPLGADGEPLRPVPVPETAPTDPRNVYAATKLHQEHLCAAFGREAGLAVTALRYHNVYGPRMPRDTPYAGVASLSQRPRAGRGAPGLRGRGAARDFVHVRDVARANVLALTSDDPVDGPVNVCSGAPRSVLDMASALCDAFATSTGHVVRPMSWAATASVTCVMCSPRPNGLRRRSASRRPSRSSTAWPSRSRPCGRPDRRTLNRSNLGPSSGEPPRSSSYRRR